MPVLPTPRDITLIGVPVEEGAGTLGCAMGPRALRTAGLARALRSLGHAVADAGDVTPVPAAELAAAAEARNLPVVAGFARATRDAVATALAAGSVPLVLGGDHSLSMGSVTSVADHCAAAGRPLFVLWLDAHADFNTPETSPSGNLHGMAAALVAGEAGLDEVLGAGRATLDPRRLTLFGIRSIDGEERALLAARGISVVDMRLIDEFGAAVLIRRVIDAVAAAGGHLHVSLDVDVLDPAIAPGAGTPVAGGATYREAHLVMELLHESGLVGSVDVVELNPFLDERGRTALLLVDLVASLFGRQIWAHDASGMRSTLG